MFSKIYYLLGIYFLGKRNWERSSSFFLKAINTASTPPSIWYYRLGFVLCKQKKWGESVPYLKFAANEMPSNSRRQIRLGMALEQVGQKTEAADIYQSIIDRNSMDAETCYKAGKLFFTLKRWGAAEKAYRVAIDQNPREAKYYYALAKSLKSQNKTWQVIEALSVGVELTNKADWYYWLGKEQRLLKQFDKAEKSYLRAVSLSSKKAEWYYELGLVQEELGNISGANISYKKAIQYDSNLKAKEYGIGVFHQKNELWLKAATSYELQIEESKSFNPELFYKTGFAYDRCFLWEKAVKFYRLAILLDKDQAGWLYRLGFALERNGQYSEAVSIYKEAVVSSAQYKPYWYYRLGFVLYLLGEYKEACTFFLNIKSNGSKAYQEMSSRLNNQDNKIIGDYIYELKQQSLDDLKEITLLNATSANSCYRLYVEYKDINDIDSALYFLKKAIARSENHNSDWYYEQALLFMLKDKYKEAATSFVNSRLFKFADGVNINPYLKNKARKIVMQYTEAIEFLPIEENTIMYESFGGTSISCNPYAIFKEIIESEEFNNWTHIWVLDDVSKLPEKYRNKDNIIICSRDSDNYIRSLATTKYLINNSTFPTYFQRRDGQKYLNTWHGTPLKTLGKAMRGRFMEHKNGTRNFLQATHLISPNPHTTEVMIHDFDIYNIFSGKLAEIGYPRVDLTFNKSDELEKELRERLGIKNNEPIVLYAPTWRGTHGGIELDHEKLISDLYQLEKLPCQLLFRGHALIQDKIKSMNLPIKVVPNEIDTNELLSVIDILVTDYSSIFFDFICTRKPIVLYCYDEEEYVDNRGLYFDIESMPVISVKTVHELYSTLKDILNKNVSHDFYPQNTDLIFDQYDDGQATRRAIDFFFKDQTTNLVPTSSHIPKENILFFGGPFMPNGITSSLLNLLEAIDKDRYHITLLIDPNGIDGFPERMSLFSKLSKDIQVIPRVGLMSMTAEDKWIIDHVHRVNHFNSLNLKDRYYLAHSREYHRILGDSKFEAVINFEGYHKFWVALLASANVIKKSIYLHNEMYAEWREKFPYLELVFNSYNYHSNIVSVSETLNRTNRDSLHDFCSDQSKFIAIPNLINPELIKLKSEQAVDNEILTWIDSDSILFITIGRMSIEKDQQKLIRSFTKASKQYPNIQLIVIGDGPLRGELERLSMDLNIDNKIMFTGILDNPFPLLKIANCFILSSNHEGQPMTLLEALTLNKQIIATDIVGNRGVLEQYGGKLVENSIDGITNGIVSYMQGDRSQVLFSSEEYKEEALQHFYKLI